MYNLPTDSTINGLSVYHEGNHSNKGNPHDNYLSKFSCNYSLNNQSTVDKMFKMCTISYPINNNVEFKYIIEILSTKIENENKLYITCGNTLESVKATFKGDTNINVYLKNTLVDGNLTIDVYIQVKQTWTKLYYRLYFARCLDYLIYYTEESAYNYIKFYNESELITLQTSDTTVNYVRNEVIKKVDTPITTVNANSETKLQIPVSGLLKNSIVSFNASNVEIPAEFIISSSYIPYNNYIVLRVRNTATYNKDLPLITWIVSFRNLE